VGAARSAYDTALQTVTNPLARNTIEGYRNSEFAAANSRIKSICPYAIQKENEEFARELAIPFTNSSPHPHPHPIHAALRNICLKEVLPSIIVTDSTIIACKEEYHKILVNACPNHTIQNHSPIYEPRDIGRFASTLEPGKTPMEILRIDTPMAIAFENGHFMPAPVLLHAFDISSKLRMFATVSIFPFAALLSRISPSPTLYRYSIDGPAGEEQLSYAPEFDKALCYVGPMSVATTLLAKTIVSDDYRIALHGQLIWSSLNTHVQLWTRWNLPGPTHRSFDLPAVMPIPRVFRNQPNCDILVPVKIYRSLVRYGTAMITVRDKDFFAKLRQHTEVLTDSALPTPASDILARVCAHIALQRFTLSDQSKFYWGFLSYLRYKSYGSLYRLTVGAVKRKWVDRYYGLIDEPNPMFTFPLLDLRCEPKPDGYWGMTPTIPAEFRESRIHFCVRQVLSFLSPPKSVAGKLSKVLASELDVEHLPSMTSRHDPSWVQFQHNVDLYNVLTSTNVKQCGKQPYYRSPIYGSAFDPPASSSGWSFSTLPDSLSTEFGGSQCSTDAGCNEMDCDPVDENEYDDMEGDQYEELTNEVHWDLSAERTAHFPPAPSTLPSYHTNDMLIPVESTSPAPTYFPILPSIQEADVAMLSNHSEDDHMEVTHVIPEPPIVLPAFEQDPAEEEEFDYAALVEPTAPVLMGGTTSPNVAAYRAICNDNFNNDRRRPYIPKSLKGNSLFDRLFPRSVGKRHRANPLFNYLRSLNTLPYPSGDCLLIALSLASNISPCELWFTLVRKWPANEVAPDQPLARLSVNHLEAVSLAHGLNVQVHSKISMGQGNKFGISEGPLLHLTLEDEHWSVAQESIKVERWEKNFEQALILSPLTFEIVALLESNGIIFRDWVPEWPRAELYVRCCADRSTGRMHLDIPGGVDSLKAMEDAAKMMLKDRRLHRKLAVLCGDPGCGKSYPLQMLLSDKRYHNQDIMQVVLARVFHRKDWADAMSFQDPDRNGNGTQSWQCETFEKAIYGHNTPQFVVIDELEIFPPGYLALKAAVSPVTSHFVALFDPFQGQFHEPNECLLNANDVIQESKHYGEYATYFYLGSRRPGIPIATLCSIPTTSNRREGLRFRKDMIKDRSIPTYVPSRAEVLRNDAVNNVPAQTAKSSIGATEEEIQIVIDDVVVRSMDSSTLYTALLRSRGIVWIIEMYQDTAQNRQRIAANELLSKILAMRHLPPDSIPPPHMTCVPKRIIGGEGVFTGKYRFSQPLKDFTNLHLIPVENHPFELQDEVSKYLAGQSDAHQIVDQLRLYKPLDPTYKRGDTRKGRKAKPAPGGGQRPVPYWMTEFPQVQANYGMVEEPAALEPVTHDMLPPPDPIPTTLLPSSDRIQVYESFDSLVKERFERELQYQNEWSIQFPDLPLFSSKKHPKGTSPLLYNPISLNAFHRMTPSDTAAFALAIKTRITLAEPEVNAKKLLELGPDYGNELYLAWLRAMGNPTPVPWDQMEFESSLEQFESRRLARPEHLSKSSADRSEPEFLDKITAKSEVKAKLDSRFQGAKKLQTLMIKSDAYLFKLGALGIYLLTKWISILPQHIYVHCRQSLQEMDQWVKRFWKEGDCQWSDKTAFDSAQDHSALHMEIRCMEFFNVPFEFIDAYTKDKLDTRTWIGHMAILRFTGELFTWLFNTWHTIARTHSQYLIPYGTPQMYSGDDEAHDDF
jgi:hypothetical protein